MFGSGSAAKDAKIIQEAVDYRLLRAAWDEYVTIRQQEHKDYSKAYGVVTPAWYALQAIIDHHGKFSKFEEEELQFLHALGKALQAYDDIIAILEEHRNDIDKGRQLFTMHPNLHSIVPSDCDSPAEITHYILGIVRSYQQQLHDYIQKHGYDIYMALQKLEKKS